MCDLMPPGNDFLCSNLLVISPQDDLLFGPWSRVLSSGLFFQCLGSCHKS